MKIYHYKAYQLNIASCIALDAFQVIKHTGVRPDVQIHFGIIPSKVQEDFTKTITRRVRFQMSEGKLLYHLLDGSKIYITNGNSIIIEKSDQPDIEFISLLIRTRGIAAILHQRRNLPLHGSAIEVNGKAILFLGRSGAGKSTITGAFIKKGYQYLADDWCVLKKDHLDKYLLQPSYPELRLWENSIELLNTNEDFDIGKNIRSGLTKYYVKPKLDMFDKAIEIKNIYFISVHQQNKIKLNIPPHFTALQGLLSNTFAKLQMEGLGGYEEQFKVLSYLIKYCKIKTIQRPEGLKGQGFWDMIEIIEQDFLA